MQHNDENENRGKESAGGGGHERAKHVVGENFHAIASRKPTPFPTLRGLLLRCSDFNANCEIGGRNNARRPRKQKRKLAIPLQFLAAVRAGIEVLTHPDAFRLTRVRPEPVVQIAG